LDAMTLIGFAALAKGAGLVICNDSGVSHVAALVRARQLTLFGVTDPALTGPLSETAMSLGGVARWPSLEEVTRAALAQLTQT
jgi:heptosyltransferase-2